MVEGASKVRENKTLTNEVVKFHIVIKEQWGDEIPRMPTIHINHRHRRTRAKVLAYFGDTEPLIQKLGARVRGAGIPVRCQAAAIVLS